MSTLSLSSLVGVAGLAPFKTSLKNLKKEENELKLKVKYKFSEEGKDQEAARKRAALKEIGIM